MTIRFQANKKVASAGAVGTIVILAILLVYNVDSPQVSDEQPSSRIPDSVQDQSFIQKSPIERGVSIRTNSWFSSLNVQFPSVPMFVFPGSYAFDSHGLSASSSGVSATKDTIFGGFDPACSLGNGHVVRSATIERYGDWDIVVRLDAHGQNAWRVHLVQGSPVVNITDIQDKLILDCPSATVLSEGTDSVSVSRGGRVIFLVQAKDGLVEYSGSRSTLISPSGWYRIIQLPDVTNESLEYFRGVSWMPVSDTQTVFAISDSVAQTKLVTITDEESSILTTLWPHQRLGKLDRDYPSHGTYRTIYGDLQLINENLIAFSYPIPDLPQTFSSAKSPEAQMAVRNAIVQDVRQFNGEVPPGGVYFRGGWLGGLASAAQIADAYGMPGERDSLLDILERHLLESLDEFEYNGASHMLVAKNPEFGNEKGNDHHFHYGYYLRAGSVLASFRPELLDRMRPTLDEMAKDIGNTDRTSGRYPFLRHFSPYEGHSWADGVGLFNDGNNQESSSEALNAWYGLSLWGRVSGDAETDLIGQWLFSQELAGVRAYWYGEKNPFPEGYGHHLVSLVWGGKRDFATWFSGDPMHIHGIQWLPITPASGYLATLPNQTSRLAEISSAHFDPATHEWGDLYAAHLSYIDSRRAKGILDIAARSSALESKALLYHTIYRNAEK